MGASAAVDWAPVWRLLALAACVAVLPLCWVWLRQRGADTRARLAALTALTVFLTFDLIVFGAFTRLTDSGLGCPDWPGCYGEVSPLAANSDIRAAEAVLPDGPVTVAKAWIEMIHRYLAMVVGALILVLAVTSWRVRHQLPHSVLWPLLTLVWVVVQGLFGKYTVTLKLYPAIVTLHLLGAQLLLALLVIQHHNYQPHHRLSLSPKLRHGVMLALVVLVVQIGLGGWVSTNYAVLACQGFPQCNGQWWPPTDFAHGFTLLRDLGHTGQGHLLPFEALVAIHLSHRWMAWVAAAALAWVAWQLWQHNQPGPRRLALLLAGLLLAQLASGLGNVVLQWPLLGALIHSAGAAALVATLVSLIHRSRPQHLLSATTSGPVPAAQA